MTPRLPILVDEHVPRAVVRALRSNGFDVVAAAEQYVGVKDPELLRAATDNDRVLLTNDRDFVRLATERSHAGVVVYTTAAPDPSTFARAVRRIDRQFDDESMPDTILWLEDWA